jgi:hypothetical protein
MIKCTKLLKPTINPNDTFLDVYEKLKIFKDLKMFVIRTALLDQREFETELHKGPFTFLNYLKDQINVDNSLLNIIKQIIEKEDLKELSKIQQAQKQAARLEAVRLEAARLEAARLEAARIQAARIQAARIQAQKQTARIQAAKEKKTKIMKEIGFINQNVFDNKFTNDDLYRAILNDPRLSSQVEDFFEGTNWHEFIPIVYDAIKKYKSSFYD